MATETGEFVRGVTEFRDTASFCFPGRYAVYVNGVCPWAQRVKTVHSMLEMQGSVELYDIEIEMLRTSDLPSGYKGWKMSLNDTLNSRFGSLYDLYEYSNPGYQKNMLQRRKGQRRETPSYTVPILWDRWTSKIVNTESDEIIEMLTSASFDSCKGVELDLSRNMTCAKQIDDIVYRGINNGVYRMGFATTQSAYEKAYYDHWEAMDAIERRLSQTPFLCGNSISLSDIKLFATTVRYDAAYHTSFKGSRNMLREMPNLMRHMVTVYRARNVARSVDMRKIVVGYHSSMATYPVGKIDEDFSDPLFDRYV